MLVNWKSVCILHSPPSDRFKERKEENRGREREWEWEGEGVYGGGRCATETVSVSLNSGMHLSEPAKAAWQTAALNYASPSLPWLNVRIREASQVWHHYFHFFNKSKLSGGAWNTLFWSKSTFPGLNVGWPKHRRIQGRTSRKQVTITVMASPYNAHA